MEGKVKLGALIGSMMVLLTLSALAGLNYRQILTITIFSTVISSIILFWSIRIPIAMLGVFLLLSIGLIDVPSLIKFANIDVVLFLVATMIIVGFLEERHFFGYLMNVIVAKFGSDARRLIRVLMLISGIFSALVGTISSALFMTVSILSIARYYKLNPVPYVVMSVFASNIGSSATVMGNPVGVLIALKSGLTFNEFIRWATPISLLSLILCIEICLRIFKEDIEKLDRSIKLKAEDKEVGGGFEITSRELMESGIVFFGTIIGLALYSPLENLLGLKKNSLLLGVVLSMAGLALLIERGRVREIIEHRVEWADMVFFIMLFASVGALEYVGITEVVAEALSHVPGGEITILITLIVMTGVLSAFLDNVLAVATIAPIVEAFGNVGFKENLLWWGVLFAGTYFGNLTLIGSTANIVAMGILEKRGIKTMSFKDWIKYGSLITLLTITLAIVLLIIQAPLM